MAYSPTAGKRRRRGAVMGLLALGLIALAFAAPAATTVDPRLAAPSEGPSGLAWIGGNKGSELMRPGWDCVSCHRKSGEGPLFLVAGTVYTGLDEPDDRFGVEGAVVQLTDATGKVLRLTSNRSGNFMSGKNDKVAMPYAAKVLFKGAERSMAARQSTGNCAMCHTAKGVAGAPGRVVIP